MLFINLLICIMNYKNMKCLICNKEMERLVSHIQIHGIYKKDYYDQFLKKELDGICQLCGGLTKFTSLNNGYAKFCSVKCAKQSQSLNKDKIKEMLEKRKNFCIKKYGVDHHMKSEIGIDNHKKAIFSLYGVNYYSQTGEFKDKMKETCLEKYGVDHFNKSDECKEKIKNGFIEKYGVDNVFKLDYIKDKIRQTKIEKYGDETYNNRDKYTKTCLKKYGVKHVGNSKIIIDRIQYTRKNTFLDFLFNGNRLNSLVTPLFKKEEFINTNETYDFKCNTCNTIFKDDLDDGLIPKCPICFKCNNISKPEIEFLDYLNISEGNRQKYIKPYKVDGIKDLKIFEFIGDYWHGNPKKYNLNEINQSNHTTFGELYNNTIMKFSKLTEMGYTIYYMWESDWYKWLKSNKTKSFPIRMFNKNYPI